MSLLNNISGSLGFVASLPFCAKLRRRSLRQLALPSFVVNEPSPFNLRGDIVTALHREIPAGLSGHAAKMAKHSRSLTHATRVLSSVTALPLK
jgi:hypothetical protein